MSLSDALRRHRYQHVVITLLPVRFLVQFCVIQLLESDDNKDYVCFTRWGRVGMPGVQTATSPCYGGREMQAVVLNHCLWRLHSRSGLHRVRAAMNRLCRRWYADCRPGRVQQDVQGEDQERVGTSVVADTAPVRDCGRHFLCMWVNFAAGFRGTCSQCL